MVINADYADGETAENSEVLDFENQQALDAYITKLETEMREAVKKF